MSSRVRCSLTFTCSRNKCKIRGDQLYICITASQAWRNFSTPADSKMEIVSSRIPEWCIWRPQTARHDFQLYRRGDVQEMQLVPIRPLIR